MAENEKAMVSERSWEEFREAGMLWWMNRILHLFGWAIVTEVEMDTNRVTRAYPARCRFRGFGPEQESEGFAQATRHIETHVDEWLTDVDLRPKESDG